MIGQAAMRHTGQRVLTLLVPRATTRSIAAPPLISKTFCSFREQRNVAAGKATTTTAPVGARAAQTEHRSLPGCSRRDSSARGSGYAADFPVEIGSRRGLSSASLCSDGEAFSVVQDGTERFLVAQRKLVAGDVLFDCTTGTLSTVRSRHSIQVTEKLHLTVSDDLKLMNHGCTPNCQFELVEGSSTAGEVSTSALTPARFLFVVP